LNHTLATRLSPIDLTLVAIYLVAITIFGLRFARKGKQSSSLKSYFLADNTIPWWAIALSIVSAETSTLTIVSIPGVAFAGDMGFLQIVLGYMLGRIVVALLFLPRYFRGEMLTAYQLIDQRFGHVLHKVTAGLFLATRAAAEGVRVFAISIVVSIAIGTGDILSIAIISALTLLYTFEGGMAAVIWTDVVQMALYLAGTLVALWSIGHQTPGGWSHIHAIAAPLGKFHMLNFAFNLTQSYTFWAGVLGGTFLTMASHGTDQLMVQRMLAARNLRESRLALLSSGVVIFLQFTLFLLIGVGLFVFYGAQHQAFRSNDYIFPTYIVQQMPHGVAGLLVAAILAAAMSNLSAALNSLASTTVIDFYVPLRASLATRKNSVILSERSESKDPESAHTATEARTFHATNLVSRLSTILWALVLFAIAVYSIRAGGKGHVVETGLSIASVAYGCLLGVFLLGTLTRHATQLGATLGMICGFAINLAIWLAPANSGWTVTTPARTYYHPWPHIAFTWYVLIGSLATFALGSLFSIVLPKRRRAAVVTATLFLLCLSFPQGICVSSAQAQAAPAQAQAAPAPDFTPISTLITEAIARHQLPGAVVLIGHNGHVVFEHAYGNRSLEPTIEPMTEDTIFDMASLTKVNVTSTAILQLYEQGKLDLDAPVAKYLPEFASISTETPPAPASSYPRASALGLSADIKTSGLQPLGHALQPAAPNSAAAWKSQITIRQLLTHYSGLPEDVDLKDDWGLRAPDKAEGIRRALAAIPYGPPGQTFKYSDINFITLGALVEKLTGQALDMYGQQNIFLPLGMRRTRFLSWYLACGLRDTFGSAYTLHAVPKDLTYGISTCGEDGYKGTWRVEDWIPNTAPTAHDDQGTAATNPNFDHLLRGTVHDPTTRRMGGVAGHAGVFSTAHDMSLFCQALLDKLLHNTGPFPLKQSTLQLATSPNEPATAVHTATIFTPDGKTTTGVAFRGLGWDLNSPYSRPRGEIFPITTRDHPGSFGHTGFTGTSLWIDPTSDTYVILLANAIHPRGAPPISTLRGQVATAAARALGLTLQTSVPASRYPEASASGFSSFSRGSGLQPLGYALASPDGPTKTGPQGLKPGFVSASDPTAEAVALTKHIESIPDDHLDPEMLESGISRISYPSTTGSRYPEASALGLSPAPKESGLRPLGYALPDQPQTQTGIDVLESTEFAALKTLAASHNNHLKLAVLANQSSIDAHRKRTIDILKAADPSITLEEIFTPEHGLFASQDTEHLRAETDPTTNLPVISLYGPKASDKHPRQSDLKNVDAVIIDLPDAGVRFWTYETVLGYFLEDCARAKVDIIVLDRPNPIGGGPAQGPLSDVGDESYIDFMSLPVRHGLTMGELAKYFNDNATQVQLKPELLDGSSLNIGNQDDADAGGITDKPPATQPGLHAALTVIPMQHWRREEYFADTGLPWVPPSPNMKTPATNIVYPGVALIETTNMSVGRGSPAPYENFGAPFVKPAELATYLNARKIPGVTFTASALTIADTREKYPFHGQTIPAIHLTVTNRNALDSPQMGIEILSALHHLYPAQFQLEKAHTILLNAQVLAAVKSGKDPREIAASWSAALAAFNTQRQRYLLYP
jgi:SSS family transporter